MVVAAATTGEIPMARATLRASWENGADASVTVWTRDFDKGILEKSHMPGLSLSVRSANQISLRRRLDTEQGELTTQDTV